MHHAPQRLRACASAGEWADGPIEQKCTGEKGREKGTQIPKCTQQEAVDIKLVRDAYVINISRLSQAAKLCPTQPPFLLAQVCMCMCVWEWS